jgi:hypothetical protein
MVGFFKSRLISARHPCLQFLFAAMGNLFDFLSVLGLAVKRLSIIWVTLTNDCERAEDRRWPILYYLRVDGPVNAIDPQSGGSS